MHPAVSQCGVGMALLAVALAIGLAVVASTGFKTDNPVGQIVLLVLTGILGLMAIMTVMVVVFASFGLTDTQQSLALPKGTVRAIIALSLLIIFIISTVYLYGNFPTGENSAEKISFAREIYVTISTLLIAVSGFYFGNRAGAAAATQEDPALRVIQPESPANLEKKQDAELSIKLETTPKGEAIAWATPNGDVDGKLVQQQTGQFVYRRGTNPADIVILRFHLARHPQAACEIVVVPK